jgi:hypothetical protein
MDLHTGASSAPAAATATAAVTANKLEVDNANDNPPTGNPLDAENAHLRREILNAMLRAYQDALQAGRPLPFPDLK